MAKLTLARLALAPVKPPAAKPTDPHYGTAAHRRWAAEVKKRARYRCQGPGCGATGVRLIADHVVERRDGGADLDPANGEALCDRCHGLKTEAARRARYG